MWDLQDLRRLAVTQTPQKKPSVNTDMKNTKGVSKNKYLDFARE